MIQKNFNERDFLKFAKSRFQYSSSAIEGALNSGIMNSGYMSPTILEEREMHVTQMDVFSRLMAERTIVFGTDFNSVSCNIAVAQLLYLSQASDEPIKILVNSPGGSVYDGYGVLETMAFIKPDVETVNIGMAASMGSLLLMCGTRGKRSSLPSARVMIHQPLGGVQGQATEIINEAKEIEKTRNEIYNLMAQRTKQPLEKIAVDCERDHWLRASEALDYGIIDSIIPITWD